MRYKRFHLFMDSQPDFYFICPTNPPASLCAPRPTFSSEDLFTSVSETCMHYGAIRCSYLISLRTKMNRGVSSWNIFVCFDYNIKSIVTDVEPMLADVGDVETTLGRHRTADIDPTSAQHMFHCIFFSLHHLPELLCAEIVPTLEAAINSGLVFGMVTDLLYTNMKTLFILTHWGPDKITAIFQTTFSNKFSWMQIYEFRLNFTEVCLQGSNWQYIPALVQINGLAPASNKPLSFCTLCLDQQYIYSSKQNSHIFRHVIILLTSITLVSQITGYSTRLFVQPVTDRWPMGSLHKKPVTQPPLGQCWYNVGIQPLV